jgi:choice-of-anchor B domain-containing protein
MSNFLKGIFLYIGLAVPPFVYAQKNFIFRSNLQYSRMLANVWGYYDSIHQKEYALVGVETGLSIVDVTNPDQPQEVFFIESDTSLWQEPKTWKHYVYMTNENGKKGLLIADLSNLPHSVNVVYWKDEHLYAAGRSHTCFVDENGFLYLNGSQVTGGTMIFDLKPNPMNPTYLGVYNDFYVHDCFVRNDTLWTAEILDGNVTVINVQNKNSPQVMARFQTPFYFTHNCWLSQDGKFLYTTDEKPYATVAVYDVSDLSNITLLDEYRHSHYDSLIPHNTYIAPDSFLHTSYYRAGVTIVDAHKKDNLVEVAHFDTSPFSDDAGFEGCWGVYPFLPSGNILASDREEGLFVLTPIYKRACYLEGTVKSQHGTNLAGIEVSFIGEKIVKRSNYLAEYKTGTANAGKYDVRFYDPLGRCQTKIVKDVTMQHGVVTELNVQLNCHLTSAEEFSRERLYFSPTIFKTFTHIFSELGGEYCVFSVEGKMVESSLFEPGYTSLGYFWKPGLYIVKIYIDNREYFYKLVKTL